MSLVMPSRGAHINSSGRHPRQQKILQTVFFNAVIGSDVPELTLPPGAAAASAVTLRPFFFGDLSAITIAPYVFQRVCSLRATATPTLSASACRRLALWPGDFCHMRNVSAQVLAPTAMFSAAGPARAPWMREANEPATL